MVQVKLWGMHDLLPSYVKSWTSCCLFTCSDDLQWLDFHWCCVWTSSAAVCDCTQLHLVCCCHLAVLRVLHPARDLCPQQVLHQLQHAALCGGLHCVCAAKSPGEICWRKIDLMLHTRLFSDGKEHWASFTNIFLRIFLSLFLWCHLKDLNPVIFHNCRTKENATN